MEQDYLTLKNIYRLITVNDYPFYSTGIISSKNKKGLTLIKFWTQYLLYNWRNTEHGQIIWRLDGSKNRYHSELCNRKKNFLLYDVYIEEIMDCLTEENLWQQTAIFSDFLKKKDYDYQVFLKKTEVFVQTASEKDPWLFGEGGGYLKAQVKMAKENQEFSMRDFWAGWLLTIMSLHAMAGNCMERMKKLWDDKNLEPTVLWNHHQRVEKRESPIFLTSQNSELNSGCVPAEHFFGREEELYDLKEYLRAGGKYVISGIGGVGKTELLRQILRWCVTNREADRIGVVQYEGNLKESLARSVPFLTGDTLEERFHECLYLLSEEEGKKTVLFIDNMNQTEEEDPELKELKNLPCTIFLSSRMKALDGFLVYPVHPPEKGPSSLIFRDSRKKVLSESERECLDEILENEVFRHPLTLRLLGKASGSKGWSVQQLKDNLEKQGPRISWREGEGEASLFDMYHRMYRMSHLTGTQERLVRMFSVLPYVNVEESFAIVFFQGFLKKGEKILEELEKLSETGWLDRTENGYRMHPVIRESIRIKPPTEQEFAPFWARAVKCYYEGQEPVEKDPWLVKASWLIFHAATQIKGEVSRTLAEIVLSSAEFVMKQYSANSGIVAKMKALSGQCADLPDECKLNLERLCMENYEWEQEDTQRLWEEQQKKQTVSDGCLVKFAIEFGNILSIKGKHEAALEILDQIREKAHRVDEKVYLAYMKGEILNRQVQPEAALVYLDKGILMARQNNNYVACIEGMFFKKGICHLMVNQISEASQFLEAWEQWRKKYRKNDEQDNCIVRFRGELAWYLGNMEEAAYWSEKEKKQAEICLGRSSFNYASICGFLGIIYNRLGKREEALENLLWALKITKELTPDGINQLHLFHNNIGVCYLDGEEPEKALPHLKEACRMAEGLGELAHGETAWNLSRAYRMLGQKEKEVYYLEEAFPVFERNYGPDHRKTKAAMERMKELEITGCTK